MKRQLPVRLDVWTNRVPQLGTHIRKKTWNSTMNYIDEDGTEDGMGWILLSEPNWRFYTEMNRRWPL